MTTLDTLRQLQAEATPGPWKVSQDGLTHPEGWDLIGPDDEAIAIDPEGYTGAIYYHANARLIAAAPAHLADLITALEREAKVREVHKPRPTSWRGRLVCDTCTDAEGRAAAHPCPTIRILDGNE